MKKSILFLMLFSLGSISLFAHALWIQTAPTAKKGEKHLVKIIWAEDGKNEQMPVGKWFSDMEDFTLYVTKPDGTKEQLSVTPGEDSYSAYFTPESDGQYILSIAHTAKDLGGTTKLDYNASALVNVGNPSIQAKNPVIDNELKLTGTLKNKYKKGETIQLSYLFKNATKEKINVEVFAPSGWVKSFETDADGTIKLPLLWSGHYAIEANYFSKDESGSFNDKPYRAIWRCMTYTFDSK